MKTLRWTVMVSFCIIGFCCAVLSIRKEWIQPRPGVRLTPSRPILREEDIPSGGAFDLLLKACDFSSVVINKSHNEHSLLCSNEWSDTTFTNLYAELIAASKETS